MLLSSLQPNMYICHILFFHFRFIMFPSTFLCHATISWMASSSSFSKYRIYHNETFYAVMCLYVSKIWRAFVVSKDRGCLNKSLFSYCFFLSCPWYFRNFHVALHLKCIDFLCICLWNGSFLTAKCIAAGKNVCFQNYNTGEKDADGVYWRSRACRSVEWVL